MVASMHIFLQLLLDGRARTNGRVAWDIKVFTRPSIFLLHILLLVEPHSTVEVTVNYISPPSGPDLLR
jgi:hypothetical protein